jgi:glutaredoxin
VSVVSVNFRRQKKTGLWLLFIKALIKKQKKVKIILMNKRFLILTILFAAVVVSAVLALIGNHNGRLFSGRTGSEKSMILFYREGCSHCARVEEYLSANNIKDKVSFKEKEVYYNRANAEELAAKAKVCGLPADSIGVPFLWDNGKCYLGDRDIIDFFEKKTNGR